MGNTAAADLTQSMKTGVPSKDGFPSEASHAWCPLTRIEITMLLYWLKQIGKSKK